ncbi:iron complex transport system permease protein [Parafrankia irregularis]|uniref:Iron complex transport system permease protein n=1 Tax=Parafrankia irregularis TaxID=795642 RepID=A0A0S4QJB8_9ACTN|nr:MULTISPECIES: iron chelate uptake ABC transporter family permease subunit [Parafrankia]MBE3200984.1 iron chelate uptake ABC transporter family permease subunit [Parafrankia sp. CH37]CUU54618.1 iron complex transport system permease protein [Parafrankia irregularis]
MAVEAVAAGTAGTAGTARVRPDVRGLGLVVAVLALGGAVVLSLTVGARHIDLGTVWSALGHDDGSEDAYIVRELRLPRTILGVGVGMALGLAGALMQALTRNPLADPGLLGVDMGAAMAVVVAIALLGITSPTGYVWFALGGAAATSTLVYLLGSLGRVTSPDRMVLAGAAVSAALSAFVGSILIIDGQTFDRWRFWVVGSLAGRGLDLVWQLGPFILVGVVLAVGLGRGLNALALGEDAGRALGVRAGSVRLRGALAVTLLCGGATAIAGPIGFVGLAVPHMARLITGPDNRWVMPYSAVLAPLLVLLADVTGRVLVAPGELEVGIVTAFLGAPVFVFLCRRRMVAL